jgi:pimeloyl-ACP methyl ester carboxylesterase
VFGVSAGGELALALGLRHPGVYGAVFCGSPGAGYQPPDVMPGPVPRVYLVAGTLEPFFLGNANRWAATMPSLPGGDSGRQDGLPERGCSGEEKTCRFPLRPMGWPRFHSFPMIAKTLLRNLI